MTSFKSGPRFAAVVLTLAAMASLPGSSLAQPSISAVIGAAAALPDGQSAPGVEMGVTAPAAAGPRTVRRCRLLKPLVGGSSARVNCYATAAFEPRRTGDGEESAMLGDPTMDHEDEILEELDVPDGVRDASEAVEVMRAWVADGALHVIFDPETFRHDVSEWGRLLGDVAQHISNAVELDGQMSRQEALARIHDAIDMSVNANAVTMEGKIKGRTEH